MRCFIAIDITEDLKREIGSIIEELSFLSEGIKWVRQEGLHITLKFLGEVKNKLVRDIISILKNIGMTSESFKLRISGAGTFPELLRDSSQSCRSYKVVVPKVVWIGVEDSKELLMLHRQIEKGLARLGFPEENREFRGHITIARIKQGARGLESLLQRLSDLRQREFGLFEVRQVILMKSELRPDGAHYEAIEAIGLGE